MNPSEKDELDKLIEALDKAKTNATEKLSDVPGGTTGKVDLQTRLDGISTVTSKNKKKIKKNFFLLFFFFFKNNKKKNF
ncbi:hypothetical protein, partial [Staphylococcus xylosus]|uniref:hypothetical protein n=1 Tax=Staphylococcus xylosus TaxID=1288 RepID=UPI003D32321A